MTSILTCPGEAELLAVATGEPAGEAIERHLDACPICRGRVELLRAELTALPRDLGEEMKPPSTEPDPAADPGGEPSGGTTLSWPSGPVGDAAAEPAGPKAATAASFGGSPSQRMPGPPPHRAG